MAFSEAVKKQAVADYLERRKTNPDETEYASAKFVSRPLGASYNSVQRWVGDAAEKAPAGKAQTPTRPRTATDKAPAAARPRTATGSFRAAHPKEVREQAVRLYTRRREENPDETNKAALAHVGKVVGVHGDTVREWVRRGSFTEDTAEVVPANVLEQLRAVRSENEQLRALQQENEQLKQKNDELKASVIYLASQAAKAA